jgi:hypothetical protein
MKGLSGFENFLLLKAEYVINYERINRRSVDFNISYSNGWVTFNGGFENKVRLPEFRAMLVNLKNRKA